jgi:hypothetical protein
MLIALLELAQDIRMLSQQLYSQDDEPADIGIATSLESIFV